MGEGRRAASDPWFAPLITGRLGELRPSAPDAATTLAMDLYCNAARFLGQPDPRVVAVAAKADAEAAAAAGRAAQAEEDAVLAAALQAEYDEESN
jgi:hypothetical protein